MASETRERMSVRMNFPLLEIHRTEGNEEKRTHTHK